MCIVTRHRLPFAELETHLPSIMCLLRVNKVTKAKQGTNSPHSRKTLIRRIQVYILIKVLQMEKDDDEGFLKPKVKRPREEKVVELEMVSRNQ